MTEKVVKHPNRLKELRAIHKLDQKDVARALKIPAPTVNRHENGNRSMDGFMIERYAYFYGVSPYEIFVPVDHSVEYPHQLTPAEELAGV